jgi:hypothetical protein
MKGGFCVSTVRIVGGRDPGSNGRRLARPRIVVIVAGAADGADDIFGPRVDPDYPGSCSAFTGEGNVDAQDPKELLRATQAAGECPRILRPSCGPARGSITRRVDTGCRRSEALPVHVLRFRIMSRTLAATRSAHPMRLYPRTPSLRCLRWPGRKVVATPDSADPAQAKGIDKSILTVAAPRRYRNREHLRYKPPDRDRGLDREGSSDSLRSKSILRGLGVGCGEGVLGGPFSKPMDKLRKIGFVLSNCN